MRGGAVPCLLEKKMENCQDMMREGRRAGVYKATVGVMNNRGMMGGGCYLDCKRLTRKRHYEFVAFFSGYWLCGTSAYRGLESPPLRFMAPAHIEF